MRARKQLSTDGNQPRFQRGDRVRFPFGSSVVIGVIIEDRGPIGVGGRRLYGIEFPLTPEELRYIELPEEEFSAILS